MFRMINARTWKRAKLLFFIIKYANLWHSLRPWSSWLLYLSIIVLKLSLALLIAVALIKTCANIPFSDDHKTSDNSVTNFTFNILVCLIFLVLLCFFLISYLSSFWYYSLPNWKMAKKPRCNAAVVIFLTISLQACADDLHCKGVQSVYGTMLRGHVFQEHNAANILACSLFCSSNIRCQSINYVISRHLCELNNRTKEVRPEDYLQDADRVYLTRPSERGIEFKISVITDLPRESSKYGQLFVSLLAFSSLSFTLLIHVQWSSKKKITYVWVPSYSTVSP